MLGSMNDRALVLFSGGQDSSTCLAWALQRYAHVETLGFDYGQRHGVELQCRPVLLDALRRQFPAWAVRLGDDHVLDLSLLAQISSSALTKRAIELQASSLPPSCPPQPAVPELRGHAGYQRQLSVRWAACAGPLLGLPDCHDNTL
jgi:7-cyano-7-deazaguanine synthase